MQNIQKHRENQGGGLRPPSQRVGQPQAAHPFVDNIILIFLKSVCMLGFGVEFTSKNQHIISGKHPQEVYVDI